MDLIPEHREGVIQCDKHPSPAMKHLYALVAVYAGICLCCEPGTSEADT